MKKLWTQNKIGRYQLGTRNVDLFWRKEGGGSFAAAPLDNGAAKMTIGFEGEWADVVTALLHESTEMAMYDCRCRWRPSPDFGNDHGGYLFTMTHEQFCEVTGRVAYFLKDCFSSVAKAYRKHKKKGKNSP